MRGTANSICLRQALKAHSGRANPLAQLLLEVCPRESPWQQFSKRCWGFIQRIIAMSGQAGTLLPFY